MSLLAEPAPARVAAPRQAVAAVRFAGVTLGHGRRVLIEDADFALPDGAFVGLFGANGAGKTTLMRAILGLVTPRAGRITLFDAAARRGAQTVGFMAQSRHWPEAALDLEAGALLDAAHPGARRAVGEALDLVDGHALAKRRLGALSGGERQRLLLAQALVGNPRLIVLDEPLAGLDPRYQAEAVALVDRVRRTLGATVLFSAHDLNALLPVMDRALWLADGRARLGAVDEVLRPDIIARLYDMPMQVLRAGGRIVVVPGAAA